MVSARPASAACFICSVSVTRVRGMTHQGFRRSRGGARQTVGLFLSRGKTQ